MTRLIRTLLALAALGVTRGLPAQTVTLEGSCSGGFKCDHVTLFTADGRSVVQLTDQSDGFHYLTFAGFRDAEDPTLLDATEIVRDGKHVGVVGQCFTRGDLSEIICSALGTQIVFTQGDSK
jgi:hypothetical protein